MLYTWIRRVMGIDELELRLLDMERHFVTRRTHDGEIVETLADVPLDKRKPLAVIRGMSMQQRKDFLERTDGGRNAN